MNALGEMPSPVTAIDKPGDESGPESGPESEDGSGPESGNVVSCWSCRGPAGDRDLFCPTCAAVQPPGQQDHFARLGLEASFDVDQDQLEQGYFDLQRQLHPDRFATKSEKERVLSQQQATSLNDAYETLKDALKRADYMIHQTGIGVLREGCNQLNDPVILMEAMELREQVAEAQSLDRLKEISATTVADIEDCEAGLSLAFRGDDLDGVCGLTTRLKFLRKLADEVRVARTRLMDKS